MHTTYVIFFFVADKLALAAALAMGEGGMFKCLISYCRYNCLIMHICDPTYRCGSSGWEVFHCHGKDKDA